MSSVLVLTVTQGVTPVFKVYQSLPNLLISLLHELGPSPTSLHRSLRKADRFPQGCTSWSCKQGNSKGQGKVTLVR